MARSTEGFLGRAALLEENAAGMQFFTRPFRRHVKPATR